MILKVIQINIYGGDYLESLIEFLSRQNPDIITMQEVSSGIINRCHDKSNLFEVLKRQLKYNGVFFPTTIIEDMPDSFIGNAVSTRHLVKDSRYVPLRTHSSMIYSAFMNPEMFEFIPRGMVETLIDIEGREIFALSCHGAWTAPPHDTEENLRQADIIASHLKSIEKPFIMGADMNMPPNTKVIKKISKYANNLMENSGISQTTHPTVHKIAPRGLLVDYIFTSEHFKKISIEAPNILISDHLPLVAEVELRD